MRFVCIDFETYYDNEYSLSKLTTEEYVRSNLFQAHGAAVKWSQHHEAKWYDAPTLARILRDEDWSDTCILCHHAQFDGLILSHWLGIKPRMWACTMSMARMLLGNHLPVGLDPLRQFFNLPSKTTPYQKFKGMRWQEMDEALRQELAEGCCDEVESIWKIFGWLAREFPASEYEVIDFTIRMFVEPVLGADVKLLQDLWLAEEKRKYELRTSIGVTEKELQSADKFCALLEAAGVEVASKSGKNGLIPAVAKTDEFMKQLLEDEDDYIRGLAEARIGAKSTLLQTRAETLGHMAERGRLCVYLRYCAAHTTRWGGGDGTNFQNFKRGSDLRRSLFAPEGYLLLVIDLAQIECRILNMLARQEDVIERFRQGHDPYVGGASDLYGRPITKVDTAERGTGKQMELSCGYGCGPAKFKRVAALGIYGPPVALSDENSKRAVQIYRSSHPAVCAYWREAANIFPWINGQLERQWGPMTVKNKKLYLPNGTRINYDTLQYKTCDDGTGEWRLKLRTGETKMYGGKMVENVVQALARVLFSDGVVRLNRAGFRPVLMSHDEVAVLIKRDSHEQETLEFCVNTMKQEPAWLPGLPVDAEFKIGERYEK